MIVLDTNVVSELMRPEPAPEVLRWLAAAPSTALFTTTLTQVDILHGLALLPAGSRRDALERAARPMFAVDFAGRVLAFDGEAAEHYADIVVRRRQGGRPIGQIDAQIAAIARSRGAELATRNVRDFVDCGIDVIDPWAADGSP